MVDPHRRATTRQLRWFAGLWFPALCAMLALTAQRHGASEAAVAIAVFGGILAVGELAEPGVIRPVYVALTWLTYPIALISSQILLGAMYYAVLTPIGMLIRLFYDPLERGFDRGAASYWFARESDTPMKHYFRQF